MTMRLLLPLVALILGSSLSGQTGNVSGTVTEASRKSALIGVEIKVEGQGLKTTTDDSGRFLLLGVAPGAIKITASYLGLAPITEQVNVIAGSTVNWDPVLSLATQTTSVTVNADSPLVGQARALNDQKNSINLINLVASDQIGSFPDPNAAEAIQRIPGIVVQRDQGEGRFVLIRGTEPRLSATTINGERIGTTENTSRQIPLDTIPADLMGAIEVTKVLTPDVEADSIGGRVNLITKRAPATRHLALTLGSGFNTLVSRDLKDYSGTYGQRFFNNKLGFIGSGNFYQNNRGSQDVEPAYTGTFALNSIDFRDYVLTRTRSGFTGDLDYRIRPGSEIYFRGLRTKYEDSELRYRLRDLIATSRLERALRDRYHDSNQLALATGGTHTVPGSWLVSWKASFTRALLRTPNRLETTFRQSNVTFAPNVTPTSIDPANIQANPLNQNLNNFLLSGLSIQNDRGNERNIAASFDLSRPSRFGSRSGGLLKFGMKVRDANRTRDVNSASQSARAGTTFNLNDYLRVGFKPADNFLGGKYPEFLSAFPDPAKSRALSLSNTLNTVVAPTGDAGSHRAKERVVAGYIMDEIYLGERTTLLPGIRFEATQTTYGAPQYNTAGANIRRTFATGKNDYLNVMPGIHLRHELFRDTPLRLSFSSTLARPNYNDLAPFALQDSTALTISRGNPTLKVTTSQNFDASIEHYFQNVGIASAGFFYKNLGNYIYTTTSVQTIDTNLYRVTQPINGAKANIYGVELTLVRQLNFLPPVLRGFAVYTNYTHVKSDAILPRGSFILPGQASDMGNASISYERKGFNARFSSNFQGRYVLAVGDSAAADNWLDNRVQLDFSASQRITKNIRVFVDLLNLGNQPYRVYLGMEKYGIQEEIYKMWAIAGVKLDF
jgi:TonB-dependent receptor